MQHQAPIDPKSSYARPALTHVTIVAFVVGAIIAALAISWIVHHRKIDPDVPLFNFGRRCTSLVQHEGRSKSAGEIRSFDIAGIHLGMTAKDAIQKLERISGSVAVRPDPMSQYPAQVIGRSAWATLATATDPKIVGPLGDIPLSTTTVRLGSTIWPDRAERITSISYFAQPPGPDHPAGYDPNFDFTGQIVDELGKALGPPTVHGRDSCSHEEYRAWGRKDDLRDGAALAMYPICTEQGGGTGDPDFVCDRRRAIRSPWVRLVSNQRSFEVSIQDGATAYASRYPDGYLKSYTYRLQ